MLLPLSAGPGTREIVAGLKQAAELAVVEPGAAGITVTMKDTKGTPEGARAAAEEAIAGGAEIILGPLFAREVAAVAPVARRTHVPVVALSSDRGVAGNGHPYRDGTGIRRFNGAVNPHLLYFTSGRKYSMVWRRPSSSVTFGSHPSSFLAFVISGLRCLGSSSGSSS